MKLFQDWWPKRRGRRERFVWEQGNAGGQELENPSKFFLRSQIGTPNFTTSERVALISGLPLKQSSEFGVFDWGFLDVLDLSTSHLSLVDLDSRPKSTGAELLKQTLGGTVRLRAVTPAVNGWGLRDKQTGMRPTFFSRFWISLIRIVKIASPRNPTCSTSYVYFNIHFFHRPAPLTLPKHWKILKKIKRSAKSARKCQRAYPPLVG